MVIDCPDVIQRWENLYLRLGVVWENIKVAKARLGKAMARPAIASRLMKVEDFKQCLPADITSPTMSRNDRNRDPLVCPHQDEDGKRTYFMCSGPWGGSLHCTQCESRWLAVDCGIAGFQWLFWQSGQSAQGTRDQYRRAGISNEQAIHDPKGSPPVLYLTPTPPPCPTGPTESSIAGVTSSSPLAFRDPRPHRKSTTE